MINRYLHQPIYSLPLLLLFFTSCSVQNKTQQQKIVIEPSTISVGYPKLIKTQGTNQYANIHCGIQDNNGNLWLGTSGEGVYRYDGKLFTQFTTKEGLSSNTVYSILEDKVGNIWIGTDAGLCRYNPSASGTSSKTFNSIPIINASNFYQYNSSNNASEKNEVWSIMQDRKGTFWFGTREGLYWYDGKIFTRFLDDPSIINKDSLQLKMVDCILEDKNGIIWFGSGMIPGDEGICLYDPTSRVITAFKPNGDGWIRYLKEDKNGNIWIGTRHQGIWRYDPLASSSGGGNFSKFMDGNDIGLSALVDREGNIWFSGGEKDDGYSSNGGIQVYDGKSLKNVSTKDGLGNYGVWCMLQDKDGNIWFGTRNIGLYRYDGKTFASFSE